MEGKSNPIFTFYIFDKYIPNPPLIQHCFMWLTTFRFDFGRAKSSYHNPLSHGFSNIFFPPFSQETNGGLIMNKGFEQLNRRGKIILWYFIEG